MCLAEKEKKKEKNIELSATYTTVVRPTLEFTSTAWDPHEQKDAQSSSKVCLQQLQRQDTRYRQIAARQSGVEQP